MKTIIKLTGKACFYLLLTFAVSVTAYAGETGKLAGRVTDKETGEPVLGANIILEGTYWGAASDIDGYYYINNIPPGTYKVIVSAVGYTKTIVENVKINIDLTTKLDVELTTQAVDIGEVVVEAKKPLIQKDLTSGSSVVSSDDIEMMPVENIDQVINLQAGVVAGHFRGGRDGEVSYMIDGIPVTDAYNNSLSVEVENSSVREMQIISGTFNAEYGQAMSGIVNIVTKDGAREFEGSVSAYTGTYFSNNTMLFENLDNVGSNAITDIQVSLGGPTPLKDLTFFFTGRYFDDVGHLFGKRVYLTSDSDPYTPSGDGDYVSMNPYRKYSLNAKLTYSTAFWKLSWSGFYDDNFNKYYDHGYRWTPDGIMQHFRDNFVQNLQLMVYPSQSTFSSLKLSYNTHKYQGYLYEDPYDRRYVDPYQGNPLSNYTYRTGGNQVGRYDRYTRTYIGQWALESQLTREHKVKMGAEARIHRLYDHYREIVNLTEGQVDNQGDLIFTLGYRAEGTQGNQSYTKFPYEASAFIQDKMEYDIMVINAGIRFDYFNANTSMPADLRNPLNNSNFPGAGERVDVDEKYQFSPRLGVSFPISDKGAIHFSYGHFFQIPNFEHLYVNDEYLINQGESLSSITGNANLDPQKTVKYEIGLQQVLFPNVAGMLSVYYSDIRNLLGMEIINTYEGFKYARFINRDYGNVRGLILTLDKRFADYFSAKVDYTFQIAEGNASDPYAVYNDNQTDPPVESEKKVVPLNWDQTSTLNISANVGQPGNWIVGIIFQYGSGTPYTEDIRISNGVRFENGGRKPSTVNVDFRVDKIFDVLGLKLKTFLLVYNVFDIQNEYGVYATTGRANYDLNVKYAGDIEGLNTIDEYIRNPAMYSSPRQIRLGMSVNF